MAPPLTEQPPRRIERRPEPPQRHIRSTQQMLAERSGPGTPTIIGRTLLGLVVALVLLAAVFLAAAALDTNAASDRAPWADPSAPEVAPPPLEPQ